jgi:SPP1 gp7 family putative phage head morphogenesis protein
MPESDYTKEIEKIVKQEGKLELDAVRIGLELLDEARRRINDSLVTAPAFEAAHLPLMRDAVDREMERFSTEYAAELVALEATGWSLGAEKIDTPIRAQGVVVAMPDLSPELLRTAQGFSADLVTGLTAQAKSAINREIQLGVLTGRSVTDVAKELGRNLTTEGTRWKTVADRAEEIARTEMARVHSLATQKRLAQAAEFVPGLQSEFVPEADACPECEALKGVYDINKAPDIPIHPSCRCDVIPFKTEWQEERS